MLTFYQGTPITEKKSANSYIVLSHNEGKDFVFAAVFLNAFPLDYEECICESEEEHGDGCPTTGWFYNESNLEYENCCFPVTGTIIAWAEFPSAEAIRKSITPD